MATMAMMPSTAHTIISSTRVKPDCFFIAAILVIGDLTPVQAADGVRAQVQQDVGSGAARPAKYAEPGIEHGGRGPGTADVSALVVARGPPTGAAAAEFHDSRGARDADARGQAADRDQPDAAHVDEVGGIEL